MNRGGLANVILVPVDNLMVHQDPESRGVIVGLTNENDFFRFPSYPRQDYSFAEDEEETTQGPVYKSVVSGSVPDNLISDYDIEYLRAHRFYIITQTTSGKVRLTGSEDVPVKCVVKCDAGELGARGEKISFELASTQGKPSANAPKIDIELEF